MECQRNFTILEEKNAFKHYAEWVLKNMVHLKLDCLSNKLRLITVWAVWFQQRSFKPQSGGLTVLGY